MDGAAVGCRYFGLGDDRPYFHPSASISPASSRFACVCISIPIYRDISHSRTVRPVLRAKQRPTFRTQRKLADGSLSSRRSSSSFRFSFPPSLSCFSLSLSLSFFFLSRKFLESQRGGEVYVSTCTLPIVISREFLESAMGNETTPTALHNAARTTRPFPERIDPLDKVSTNNVA